MDETDIVTVFPLGEEELPWPKPRQYSEAIFAKSI
jgi:hypothetical protein